MTTLLKHARDMTSDRHLLKKELEHLQGATLKRKENDDEQATTAKIAYVEGLGEEIRRILKDYNIRTVL